MIKKTKTGYQVVSESGRPLSKPNLTRKEAVQRLKEVEFFKRAQKK